MKDIKYQEQTRQSTFAHNSITAPDESSKILAAAKDQVNRMEKNRKAELQQNKEYLSTLRLHKWEERNHQAKNYHLEDDFNKDYVKALNVRLAADKNKIKLEEQEKRDVYSTLTEFSQTALGVIQKVDQKMAEDASAMGKYLSVVGHLSPDSIVFRNKSEQQSESYQTAINGYVNSLRMKGVDQQTINSILNMSGRTKVAAMKHALSTAGDNAYIMLLQGAAEVHNIEGIGPTSIAEVLAGKGDVNVLNQLIQAKLAGTIKGFELNEGTKGYNPRFIADHYMPGFEKAKRRLLAEHAVTFNKVQMTAAVNDRKKETLGTLKGYGGFDNPEIGQNIFNLIFERAGGDTNYVGYQKQLFFEDALSGVVSGEIKSYDIYKLGQTWVTIPGQGKKLFKDHYKYEYGSLIAGVNQRSTKEEHQSDIVFKAFNDEVKAGVASTKARVQRALNAEEIGALKQSYIDKGYDLPRWVLNEDVSEALADDIGETVIQAKIGRGLWTTKEAYSGKYSKNLIQKHKNKIQDGINAGSEHIVEGTRAGIKAAIAEAGGKLAVNPSQRDYEIQALSGIALAELEERVSNAMLYGTYSNVDDAWNKEGDVLRREIEAGTGKWALKKQADGKTVNLKGGFALFDSPYNGSVDQITKDMTKAVRNDGDIINQKEFYPENIIQATNNIARTKEVPQWALNVAHNYKNLNPYDIINLGRELHGLDRIEIPGYPQVDRRFMMMLEHKSSKWKTMQAVAHTNRLHNPGSDHLSETLRWSRRENVQIDQQFDGYDAAVVGNVGSSRTVTGLSAFQTPLVEMTIDNVLELQSQGRLNEAGAYSAKAKQINLLLSQGLIQRDDIFNQETQDTIGRELIYRQISHFETSDGDLIDGVGQSISSSRGSDGVFDDIERLGGIQAIYADLAEFTAEFGLDKHALIPELLIKIQQIKEALAVNG